MAPRIELYLDTIATQRHITELRRLNSDFEAYNAGARLFLNNAEKELKGIAVPSVTKQAEAFLRTLAR